ncbi:cysteine-rich protein 2-binding protein [Hydra vulgaris]|uniref:Cysteine-rich protein 2-binding protein n=1 Tax=Hydra vulgaris TaxID=6087 RepID=A0ABM4BDX3_HYDVU
MFNCKYCSQVIANIELDNYKCHRCSAVAHLACMNCKKPSQLKGDYLFSYECKACSYEGCDSLIRLRLSWVQVIHLVLYNLTVSESGRQGYFRWKEEICLFIDRHWNCLMHDRAKSSTWVNTVAGTLSVHSQRLFKSGLTLFRETGWWALQEITPAYANIEKYSRMPTSQKQQPISFSELVHDYGRGKRQRKAVLDEVSKKNSKEGIKNVIFSERTDSSSLLKSDWKIPKLKIKTDMLSSYPSSYLKDEFLKSKDQTQVLIKQEPIDLDEQLLPSISEPSSEIFSELNDFVNTEGDFDSNTNNLSSVQYNPILKSVQHLIKCEEVKSSESEIKNELLKSEKDLQAPVFDKPVLITKESLNRSKKTKPKKLIPLSSKEEIEFLSRLNSCQLVLKSDASARRLRRKLLLRKQKREMGLVLFDLDNLLKQNLSKLDVLTPALDESYQVDQKFKTSNNHKDESSYHHPALKGVNVLDRFIKHRCMSNHTSTFKNVFSRLIGNPDDISDTHSITSPYTSRVLKPYIRRDFNVMPPKLKLHKELFEKCGTISLYKSYPVDYCYVQPKHIPAVNALCSDFFWPGIELTECLQYPEFSCVVQYRKLLIGFAFMVPDVKLNEAYISFIFVHPDWQRAGIATQMIYHLIQTCMGKDITLHVSPSNPSMVLYQKFGFKIQELVLDFYEKYLPEETPGSKHAFLMRLQR